MKAVEARFSSYAGRLKPVAERLATIGKSNAKPTALKMVPSIMEVRTLSNICNARCLFCFGREKKIPKIVADTTMINNFIREAASLGVKQIDFSAENSEPTLHKGFTDFLKTVAANNLKLGLYTNAIALKSPIIDALTGLENGLGNFIVVNLSAADPQTYRTMYGVDKFQRVVDNLRNLVGAKTKKESDLRININYTLYNANSSAKQIQEMFDLVLGMGVDYLRIVFPFPPLYVDLPDAIKRFTPQISAEQIELMIKASTSPQKIVFRREEDMTGYDPSGYCWAQFQRGVLEPDGTINVCCRTYKTEDSRNGFSLGRYSPGNLEQIWNSPRKDLKVDKLCHACAPGDATFIQAINDFLLSIDLEPPNEHRHR